LDLAASAGEFDEVGLDVDDLVAQAESLSKELKARVTDSGSTLMDTCRTSGRSSPPACWPTSAT
jgi:hypothetical protein